MAIGYINAGGRGTRLNGLFTPDPETGIAKALLEIGNPPIKLIDHHIANLHQQGIDGVVVAAGDQHDVYEYIRDTYDSVQVTKSTTQLGTGGDLVCYARQVDTDEAILVQNVDTILAIDLRDLSDKFSLQQTMGSVATIALTINRGVPNENAFFVNESDRVVASEEFNTTPSEDESFTYRASSTGAVIFEPSFLRHQDWRKSDGQLSIYRDILRQAQRSRNLYAYNNQTGFFRDVGTIGTWLASEKDNDLQQLLRYNQR